MWRVRGDVRLRLEDFLRPLYQELDGASRADEVERIARIARRLYVPAPADARAFELLLRFHRLGRWLERVGNLSRTALAVDEVTEDELRRTAASIARLQHPVTEGERAVAAAVMIDGAGVRGLVEQFTHARREGSSVLDILRNALADVSEPEWLSDEAREWLRERREARREVCRRILEEM